MGAGPHRDAAPTSGSGAVELVCAVVAVAVLEVFLGSYAVALNRIFYGIYGPFYDSMSYLNGLAEMQTNATASGTAAALVRQISISTVVYPWVAFAPFAGKIGLSRDVGVWIQVGSATYMQLLLFYYFLRVRALPFVSSLVFSSVFVLIAAVFHFNGGLSDFRMDLIQYYLLTAVMALYLIAQRSDGYGWWIALGAGAGLLCLGRATSLVYLAAAFIVLFFADLSERVNARQTVNRWLLAMASAAVVAGWFYALNFNYLYYYYVVWNPDANARLPLSVSSRHLSFALAHVGTLLAWALCFAALMAAATIWRSTGMRALTSVNWRPLVFSAVPLGHLVISGAGLNPFVSIVGVGGVMMFLLQPLAAKPVATSRWVMIGVVVVLIAGGLVNAKAGLKRHAEPEGKAYIPRREGLAELVRVLVGQVDESRTGNDLTFAVLHIGAMTRDTLFNTFVFDHSFAPGPNRKISIGAKTLSPVGEIVSVSTELEWLKYHGATDQERIDGIVSNINRQTDFLLMAVDGSRLLEWIYMNRFVPEINRRVLQAGEWTQVSAAVSLYDDERIAVFRNERRRKAATQPERP
jgi:hypothetical protein